MIKILVIPSCTEGGVFYYRIYEPFAHIARHHKDEFFIEINNTVDFNDYHFFDNYDIVFVHKGVMPNAEMQDKFWKCMMYCSTRGIKTVYDLDDYWDYGEKHPLYYDCIAKAVPEKTLMNFKIFNYVTTTTPAFADKIRPYNPNVYVFENAIDEDDPQFSTEKNESTRLRVGFTGGASHTEDLKQIYSIVNQLNKDEMNKIQIVLCGFNTMGKQYTLNENNEIVKTEDMPIEQNWWTKVEKILTKDYTLCSPEYKEYLMKYDINLPYDGDINKEFYRRIPTKDILKDYGTIYKDIDVLLAPIVPSTFNYCKSELKFIEAGYTNTACIATDTGPYRIFCTNGKDGLLVDSSNKRGWAAKIKHLLYHPNILEYIRKNLHDEIMNKYTLNDINKKRIEFFRQITNKKAVIVVE